MIKASELRIGNLVYTINRTGELHLPVEYPFKVLKICLFHVEVLAHDVPPETFETFIEYKLSDIEPIPLTEEWLLMFGVGLGLYREWGNISACIRIRHTEKSGITYVLEYSEYCGDDVNSEIEVIIAEFNFVHQLQNLRFALTGEELQIVK